MTSQSKTSGWSKLTDEQKRRHIHKYSNSWYHATKEQRSKDPVIIKRTQDTVLRRKYNMTMDEKQVMIHAQDGKCAMCGLKFDPLVKPTKKTYSVIDHDHNTRKLRGILCGDCNLKLGIYEGIKEIATNYLNRSALND